MLTVTSGSITAGGQTGSTVTLIGTASSINTALSAATYTGNLNFHGSDTLSATTTDGGGPSSGLKQFAITVAEVTETEHWINAAGGTWTDTTNAAAKPERRRATDKFR